jgi:DNA-binding transcriptional MerR regulator
VCETLLTIGELARRTGVAASALRYWEHVGLLAAPARISGQRRYPESAVTQVALLLLRRDAGFSLGELKTLAGSSDDWRELYRRKLAELDEQLARTQAARVAIEHALRCPYEDTLQCPNFRSLIAARLDGQSLHEAHTRMHASAR